MRDVKIISSSEIKVRWFIWLRGCMVFMLAMRDIGISHALSIISGVEVMSVANVRDILCHIDA